MKRYFSSIFLILFLLLRMLTPVACAEEIELMLPADPNILAKAALLVDLNTGQALYGKDEHLQLYPASLTKIMTALLVLEAVENGALSMEQELTASETILTLPTDGSTANIKVGEVMSVKNLLYCLMVVSANEAADVLAEGVSGSVNAFVDAMNQKAEEIGCQNTHFVNPNGIHDPDHYSSAWDIYLITQEAMEYSDFITICDTANIVIPATNMSAERNYWTTNNLISSYRAKEYRNEDAHGVKTGSTSQAGFCLVSTAIRTGVHLLSVVMGAERVVENGAPVIRSFSETNRLFNWGFENFHYTAIATEKEAIEELPVSLSRTDHVLAVCENDVEALIPMKLTAEDMVRDISFTEQTLDAPVERGQLLGTMQMSYNGQVYGSVNLLAANDAPRSSLMVAEEYMKDFLRSPILWTIGGAVLAVGIGILMIKFLGERGSRYGKGGGGKRRGSYHGKK